MSTQTQISKLARVYIARSPAANVCNFLIECSIECGARLDHGSVVTLKMYPGDCAWPFRMWYEPSKNLDSGISRRLEGPQGMYVVLAVPPKSK